MTESSRENGPAHITPAIVAAGTFLVCFLATAFYPTAPTDSILEPLAREFEMESTRIHLPLYAVLLFVLSLYCIVILLRGNAYVPTFTDHARPESFPRWSYPVVAGLLLVVCDQPSAFAIGVFVTLGLVWLSEAHGPKVETWLKRTRWPIVLMLSVILIILFVVPVAAPLHITHGTALHSVEMHYAMTVLPGADLVCCAATGVAERVNYGPGMTLLVAAAQALLTTAGVPATETLVLTVQLYQWVAIMIICGLIWLLNRQYALVLIVFFLIATYSLGLISPAVYLPNQAGIRYIPFMVGIGCLVLCARARRTSPVTLGTIGGTFVYISPEIGIALIAGFAVYAVLERYDTAKPWLSLFVTIGSFTTAAVGVFAGLWLAGDPIFNAGSQAEPLSFARLFASGHFSVVSRPDLLAVIIVFFATLALVHAVCLAANNRSTRASRIRAAIAAMMLVWLGYYLNRMENWNLWFQGVLLILMAAPGLQLPDRLDGYVQEVKRSFAALIAALTAGGLVGIAVDEHADMIEKYTEYLASNCIRASSRYCIEPDVERALSGKLEALEAARPTKSDLILTGLSAHIRLRGHNSGFPWYDPFGEITHVDELERVRDWISKNQPARVFIDDVLPLYEPPFANRPAHFLTFIEDNVHYAETRQGSGWRVFQRLSGADEPRSGVPE